MIEVIRTVDDLKVYMYLDIKFKFNEDVLKLSNMEHIRNFVFYRGLVLNENQTIIFEEIAQFLMRFKILTPVIYPQKELLMWNIKSIESNDQLSHIRESILMSFYWFTQFCDTLFKEIRNFDNAPTAYNEYIKCLELLNKAKAQIIGNSHAYKIATNYTKKPRKKQNNNINMSFIPIIREFSQLKDTVTYEQIYKALNTTRDTKLGKFAKQMYDIYRNDYKNIKK